MFTYTTIAYIHINYQHLIIYLKTMFSTLLIIYNLLCSHSKILSVCCLPKILFEKTLFEKQIDG